MTPSAPETGPATPALVPMPMAESVRGPKLTLTAMAAAGGFVVSLIGHSAFVIWGIGLWDMAAPLSAAPPPSVMVDLVDDPWKTRKSPDSPGSETGGKASSPLPTTASTPSATATPAAASPPSPTSATAAQAPLPYALPSPTGPDLSEIDPDTPTGLRIAQMLQVPIELPVDLPDKGELGGGAAEQSAQLTRAIVDEFKDRLRTCWTPPPEAVGDDRIKVLIRVALQRDGSLLGEPALVQAVATPAGPAMVKSAIAAVRNCQPYAFLPAEQYKQWRILDVGFSAKGVL